MPCLLLASLLVHNIAILCDLYSVISFANAVHFSTRVLEHETSKKPFIDAVFHSQPLAQSVKG
jgi:hypothetical protein